MMNKICLFATSAISALCLASCSGTTSKPLDAGHRISQRGNQITSYGDAWSAGQKGVNQGKSLIAKSDKGEETARKKLAKAQKDVAKAEANIQAFEKKRRDGAQLIAEGSRQMVRAEEDYTSIRAGPPAAEH